MKTEKPKTPKFNIGEIVKWKDEYYVIHAMKAGNLTLTRDGMIIDTVKASEVKKVES